MKLLVPVKRVIDCNVKPRGGAGSMASAPAARFCCRQARGLCYQEVPFCTTGKRSVKVSSG